MKNKIVRINTNKYSMYVQLAVTCVCKCFVSASREQAVSECAQAGLLAGNGEMYPHRGTHIPAPTPLHHFYTSPHPLQPSPLSSRCLHFVSSSLSIVSPHNHIRFSSRGSLHLSAVWFLFFFLFSISSSSASFFRLLVQLRSSPPMFQPTSG